MSLRDEDALTNKTFKEANFLPKERHQTQFSSYVDLKILIF